MKKAVIKIPIAVRDWYSKIGFKGGVAVTEKKIKCARKNGKTPCKPGKFRGRPTNK